MIHSLNCSRVLIFSPTLPDCARMSVCVCMYTPLHISVVVRNTVHTTNLLLFPPSLPLSLLFPSLSPSLLPSLPPSLPLSSFPLLFPSYSYSSPLFQSCRSCAVNNRRHGPNVNFTQFVLEEEGTESLSSAPPNLNDYSFVPILLWKPHPCSDKRHRGKTPGFSETERGVEGDGKLLLKKTDLSESLPPTISHSTCSPSTTGQNKQRKIIEVSFITLYINICKRIEDIMYKK